MHETANTLTLIVHALVQEQENQDNNVLFGIIKDTLNTLNIENVKGFIANTGRIMLFSC